MAKSDFETATPRPYIQPSTISAPYGSCVQPSPGGTTSPCALSAIVGPVAEAPAHDQVGAVTMPLARTSACRHRMALDREAQRLEQLAARSACGAQSPGGLSDGTLHQLGEERLRVARCAREEVADAFAVGAASRLRLAGREVAQEVEQHAHARRPRPRP